ncbi:MAG TPA: methyltransferase domain-containing protein [Candidatus Hodarchaeales archaeon]|nr:methyltransferase domain-containing protein [Candidatus Hodarchaeales archaeon]
MNPFVKLPKVPVVSGRQEVILLKCKGKRVLHLGCVDAGLFERRLEQGRLMHQKLSTVSEELWGVDIDGESISLLEKRGYTNLIVGDICHLDKISVLREKPFDVIVASEVLEHLENPGMFLDAVRVLMVPGKTELVITVPNAFSIDTLLCLLQGVERVHPDHNYWFSYYTLKNLIQKKNFKIEEIYVYSFQQTGVLPVTSRLLFKRLFGKQGERTDQKSSSSNSPVKVLFTKRFLAYFQSLPKRVLVSVLYKKTPFWGDGIIISVKACFDDYT